MNKNRKILYKEVIIFALNLGYYLDKEEIEVLFQDNYQTYEFIKSYLSHSHITKLIKYSIGTINWKVVILRNILFEKS